MKKEVLVLSLLLILVLPFALAAENDTDAQKVNSAYNCLQSQVKEKTCDELSLEEQIFSKLAINKCASEINEASKDGECWPKSNCDIKTTAQAILALDGNDKSEDWLISKNMSPSKMTWYLQIDSAEATTCQVNYADSTHNILIGENKKINTNAGNCLSLSSGDYWLKVAPSCYKQDFEITCDKGFLTTFLFKRDLSDTIHVSKKYESASANNKITTKIESSCFGAGSVCDYEGTLWAAIVLDSMGHDISSSIPYLMTLLDENKNYLPESFIYLLTDYVDLKSDLIQKQKTSYWDESNDKFYDTAVAMLALKRESRTQTDETKKWILSQQDEKGCIKTDFRNSAFLLYSVWPKTYGGGSDSSQDCKDAGYTCGSSFSCNNKGGEILSNFDCSGTFECCNVLETIKTCDEQAGTLCNSEEICAGGTTEDASDLGSGETCCISGSCKEELVEQEATCGINGGTCELSTCGDDSSEDTFYTCDFGDICCMPKSESTKKTSSIWIWIFVVLIILVIVGIVFRDKLRIYWDQISSKFGGGAPLQRGTPPPRFPPSGMQRPQRTMIPRRAPVAIRPPVNTRPVMRRPVPVKKSNEMDDVLKKLKEMGK